VSVPAPHTDPEGASEQRRAALLCGLGLVAVALPLVLDPAAEGTSYRAPLLVPAAAGVILAACAWLAAQRATLLLARRLVLWSLLAETVALGGWLQFLNFAHRTNLSGDGGPSRQLLLAALVLAFLAGVWRPVPAWVPWLVPALFAGVFLVSWHREATWTGGGDPQPNLVLVVSCVMVAAYALAALGGLSLRHRLAQPRT
jgi:hypothetical protein